MPPTKQQIFKILDPETHRRSNSIIVGWKSSIAADDFIELSAKYTVARMLEREDFNTAVSASSSPLVSTNSMYPWFKVTTLLSSKRMLSWAERINGLICLWVVKCNGNTVRAPQIVLTMPLLEGTDGVHRR